MCNLLETELHTIILHAVDPSHGATLLHATLLHPVTVPLGGINIDAEIWLIWVNNSWLCKSILYTVLDISGSSL